MLTRRQFTGLGFGAATSLLVPSGRPARGQATSAPFVLMVYASGGWDPTMVFDDKLTSSFVDQEAGARQLGVGGLVFVDHAQRPAVKSFFTAYGSRTAVVNGISSGSMERRAALSNIWGFVPPKRVRPVDWLTYYVGYLNPVLDIPHAVLDAPYMPGDYSSLAVRLGKRIISEHAGAVAGAEDLGTAGEAALSAFRTAAFTDLDKSVATGGLDQDKLRALFYGQARERLITSRLTDALAAVGNQGTDSDGLRHAKIAIELFAAGATQCATVQIGRTDLWDTRSDHYATQSANYQALFADLTSILQYANSQGILDSLLLLVVSERGRTPRLNAAGGKGPWPTTSMLLCGPGIKGNTVVTASDAALRSMPINPLFGATDTTNGVTLAMENVFAALYLRHSVPYQLVLPDVQPLAPILEVA